MTISGLTKRFGAFAFVCLLASVAFGSTTVTGNLKDLTGAAIANRTFVRFNIRNCGGNQPRKVGTGVIVPNFYDLTPDASGVISGTLYDNSEIQCGTTTNTWYGVVITRDGKPGPEVSYLLSAGSFNLNSGTPLGTAPSSSFAANVVITNPPGDQTVVQPGATVLSVNNFTVTGTCTGCGGVAGQKIVDGVTYATIQAAITAAGTTGSVLIPSTYAGTDVYTNANKIQILDLRKPSNRQHGVVNVLTDCGLKGDGATDDAAAIATCFANNGGGAHFFFPQTNFANGCSYFFASSIIPTAIGTVIEGASGTFINSTSALGGTVLCFAAGVTGINFSSGIGGCGDCTVKNIALLGSEGTQHLQNTALLNIPSGANLPLTQRSISSIQRASNVLTVSVTRVTGVEGLTQQVGSTVKISGVAGDATMNGLCDVATLSAGVGTTTNPTTFTCAQNGADSGPYVSDGIITPPTTGASTADGIKVCNNFNNIYNVIIQNFGRHGVNADSNPGHGCASAFSDDLVMRDNFIVDNQGDGYICSGVDCNANLLTGNAFYYMVGWGINDQSSLGNTHVGNQISNNGHQWTSLSTPATKTISTVTRTSGTVAVVMAQPILFVKLGSCVFVAGVTDSSFNTTAGQCFFITSFTDSSHFSYIQPGAPVDASSSGGTLRFAKFSEAYLSSGLDDGAMKIQTQSAVAMPVIVQNYVEGGQYCKFGGNVINIGGANIPVCAQTADWTGRFFTTQGCASLGGVLCSNLGAIANGTDAAVGLIFKGGVTTDQNVNLTFENHSGSQVWQLSADTSGTIGTTGTYILSRNAVRRLGFWGPNNSSGITRINSESTGAVQLNIDANSGTGGWLLGSGGASPTSVATIDATGLGTFNGGVKAGSSGSTIADTRELFQSIHSCGTTTTCANTANGSNKMVFGSVALTSASPSTATITGITPFTSSSSYFCVVTNATTQTNPLKVANVSSSSFTITGPNTVTDTVNYQCVGN